MKLKSGKILPLLPRKLHDTLEECLPNFKMQFSEDKQHAKELLKIVSTAVNMQSRFAIRDKINAVYDNDTRPDGNADLMAAAGNLTWLLIDNFAYRNIIKNRINSYDLEDNLEADLLGNMDENNIS